MPVHLPTAGEDEPRTVERVPDRAEERGCSSHSVSAILRGGRFRDGDARAPREVDAAVTAAERFGERRGEEFLRGI
jgi:hypothetical protein